MSDNYICAVDIGSSKLSGIVLQLKKKKAASIAFASVPSKGVRGGVIVDSIDMVGAISALMKELKAKSGISVKYVYTTISGRDIVSKHSKAIIPLAERGNKVITVSDIRRVNDQAKILGSNLEEEIIHMIPAGYTIDSKSGITNPLGLYSHRLEADVFLVCAKLAALQGLSRAVNQSGCEIREAYFSGLVSSRAVMDSMPQEGLTVVCDVGCDITEILIFSPSGLRSVDIVAMGGNDLTTEICNVLKVPPELAEEIKRSYGVIGNPDEISQDKEILIKKASFYKPIKQRLVAEIVSRKAKEICVAIKDTVEKKAHLYEINNFNVVGRSMLLEGFIESLENTIGIPVRVGRFSEQQIPRILREDPAMAGQNYLPYLTAAGILSEALYGRKNPCIPEADTVRNPFLKAINRFRDVYQEYF